MRCGITRFVIGVGWNEDEATHHGVDFRRRRALVREQILAMQRLIHSVRA
ncbi:hypothetical protein [Sorangium sp. So ce861]